MTNSLAVNSTATLIADLARDKDFDAAKLREILAVREALEATEARKAFNFAVGGFQQEAPIIAKGDSANGRPYARMDRIWRAVRPLLQKYGLSLTWESVTIENNLCRIAGHLRHVAGHAEPLAYTLPMPNAISGQNEAQRMGSATTYAKRYATCSALGVQTGEDDDANALGGSVASEPRASLAERKQIVRAGTDAGLSAEGIRAIVKEVAGVDRSEDIPAAKVRDILKAIAAEVGA